MCSPGRASGSPWRLLALLVACSLLVSWSASAQEALPVDLSALSSGRLVKEALAICERLSRLNEQQATRLSESTEELKSLRASLERLKDESSILRADSADLRKALEAAEKALLFSEESLRSSNAATDRRIRDLEARAIRAETAAKVLGGAAIAATAWAVIESILRKLEG